MSEHRPQPRKPSLAARIAQNRAHAASRSVSAPLAVQDTFVSPAAPGHSNARPGNRFARFASSRRARSGQSEPPTEINILPSGSADSPGRAGSARLLPVTAQEAIEIDSEDMDEGEEGVPVGDDDDDVQMIDSLRAPQVYPLPPAPRDLPGLATVNTDARNAGTSGFWGVFESADSYDQWVRRVARLPAEIPALPEQLAGVSPELAWAHTAAYRRLVSAARRASGLRALAGLQLRDQEATQEVIDRLKSLI
ncbi:hypothetical protein PENSPDRAFT_694581 [Peniophora sp. CONT]|nr:hypothetical protein PENSPDRAFT_694581 [Peniophora sp. CONT]